MHYVSQLVGAHSQCMVSVNESAVCVVFVSFPWAGRPRQHAADKAKYLNTISIKHPPSLGRNENGMFLLCRSELIRGGVRLNMWASLPRQPAAMC